MRILLDTAPFLWIVGDAPELSSSARAWFEDPGNEVYLSAISAWEIAVKHSLGRLPLPGIPGEIVPALRDEHGIEPLPLDEESALHVGLLPALHRDPFDRMLICQAIVGGMSLLTPDETVRRYPVRALW